MQITRFIKELLKTWWGRLWSLLAVISTLSTFVAIYVRGFTPFRWIPLVVAVIAWLFAPYKLFASQQNKIAQLRNRIGKPGLVIHPESRSAFYVHRDPTGMHALGTYLEIDLTIENKGEVNSVIARFDLQVKELGTTFGNLVPHPRQHVQTRNSNYQLTQEFIARTNKLLVGGKNFVKGILPLYLDQAPGDTVTELHCVLTAIDTDGETATGAFVLKRQGN
jgi:hypothetical protein